MIRQGNQSKLEGQMALILKTTTLPESEREARFHPTRRWRFDFAWVGYRVALEVEGGRWNRGRHLRPSGFQGDCEKYNEAALLGWVVIRVTDEHINSGQALEWVQRALKQAER
jgi:very-short-patch-repair endonuclease